MSRRTMLFVTSNGKGLGHITRLMALARRCPPTVRPAFFTMSASFPIVARNGFLVEHFPDLRASGLSGRAWMPMLAQRLEEIIDNWAVDLIVFDGVRVYPAFREVRARHPDICWVWCRRGMWMRDANRASLTEEDIFDLVIEPGDAAGVMDVGRTVGIASERVRRVPPITLLDPDEACSREYARAALGLPSTGPAVLVQLSCNSTEELIKASQRAERVIRRHLPGASVFSPQHPLHAEDTVRGTRIRTRPVYPLSRYLPAFDLAVSGAGYNSFHELLTAAIPTLFVPKPDVQVDDQAARARFAGLAGFALYADRYDDDAFDRGLERLLADPTSHAGMTTAARSIRQPNGALPAARTLSRLARRPTVPG